MIGPGKRLVLPAYELVDIDTNDFGGMPSTEYMEPKDWSGVPITTTPMKTPIAWHRGMWAASMGFDPERDDFSGIFEGFGTMTIPTRQYGRGVHQSGTFLRTPATILFNLGIAPALNSSYPLPSYNASEIQSLWDTAIGYLDTIEDELAAKNVFAAPCAETVGDWEFCLAGFPRESQTLNVETAFWELAPEKWVGGDVLVLYGLYAHDMEAGNVRWYRFVTAHPNPVVLTEIRAGIIDSDLDNLADGSERFHSFTQKTYLREYDFNAQNAANSTGVTNKVMTDFSSVSNYGMELKGPYSYNEDISAEVIADIRAWLATL